MNSIVPAVRPKATLVLGVHRSGTSAITRFINLLGASLPEHLMPAAPNNNRLGFWESTAVMKLNDELLNELSAAWDDWTCCEDSILPPDERRWTDKISSVLVSEFAESKHFVLKDPRICLCLPLWLSALQKGGFEVSAVIARRHPFAIAKSLKARDGFPIEKGLLLWAQHSLLAERFSRPLRRVCIDYDSLLEDWKPWATLLRERTELGSEGALNDGTAAAIGEFLRSSERHQSGRQTEFSLPDWSLELYELLGQINEPDFETDVLDKLFLQWRSLANLVRPSVNHERSVAKLKTTELQKQFRALEQRENASAKRLAEKATLTSQLVARVEELETETKVLTGTIKVQRETAHQLENSLQAEIKRSEALRHRSQNLQHKLEGAQASQITTLRAFHLALMCEHKERPYNPKLSQNLRFLRNHSATIGTAKLVVKNVRRLVRTGLFDSDFYRRNNPDVAKQGISPELHWVSIGHIERRNPNAVFDVSAYLRNNPDVAESQTNPLLHYLDHGFIENRRTGGFFHAQWYLQTNPDVAQSGIHPLEHFWLFGRTEARSPHPLMDLHRYLSKNRDVYNAKVDPIEHALIHGAQEKRSSSAYFWPEWYRQRYPEVGDANPLLHYLNEGASRLLAPNPLFIPDWYAQRYGIEGDAIDLLVHYLSEGWQQDLDPAPWFDAVWYREKFMTSKELERHPLGHFLENGLDSGAVTTSTFSAESYLQKNQDVANANQNAFAHWLKHGLIENRPGGPAPVMTSEDSLLALANLPDLLTANGELSPDPTHPNLLVCAHSANNQLFGGERSFIDLLILAGKLNYNVHVLIPRWNPNYIDAVAPYCCDIWQVPYKYWRAETDVDVPAIRRIEALLISYRIDLIHVNTMVVREPLIAARNLDIPSLVHVRESVEKDSWMCQMIGMPADQICRHVTDSCDVVVANSTVTADEFHKPEKTCIVPNTFDGRVLDLTNEVDPTLIRVGLISSNIPKKGLEDFAMLALHCAEKLPKLEFLLIGPETESIRALKARQVRGELGQNLKFAGYQDTPVEALRLVNVVLSLSLFAESFGRTVAEALLARRPVIVYDSGAIGELVKEGVSGHIVKQGDWKSIAPILERWSKQPELLQALGENGRQDILARFSRDVGIAALDSAYSQAMQQRQRQWPIRMSAGDTPTRREQAELRLAYFCWHFPVPSETFVLNELRELVRSGIDVEVYCRQIPHPDFEPDFKINWTRINNAGELADILQDRQRNHVHAHFTYPTVTDMVWPACEQANVDFSFIAHAQDIFKHQNDSLNRVGEIASSQRCRAVFTLGHYHRDFLISRGAPADKVIINPNAVDVSRFPYRSPVERKLDEPLRVCAIQRFTEKKGLKYLIEAAELLRDNNVVIDIYGYGELEPQLTRQIESHGLQKMVRLRGALESSEAVLEALQRSHLFACPCVRVESGDMDGIPTAIVEAMCAGTPVITTNIASIPDLVSNRVTGMLVASADAKSLANGLRNFAELSHDEILGLSENARRVASQRHNAGRLTRRLLRHWLHDCVDIVIVSWNNLRELQAVVSQVFKHTASPFHLIICDNGSTVDVTYFLIELQQTFGNVTVLHQGNNTFVGPGTNASVNAGVSEFVIYLCGKEGFALQNGWESTMVDFMQCHPDVGLGGSLGYSPSYLHGRNYPDGIALFEKFRNREFANEHPDREFFHIQGGLFIMRRSMYQEIGGFSDDVPHAYTDVEYSYYAESCGWKLANIPGVLALYNKTRPDFWSRMDEYVEVIHPPKPEDLELLERIVGRRTKFCNICRWAGQTFIDDGAKAICPNCKADGNMRALYRWLAESKLTYRRLPALWINPHGSLLPFWKQSFQGRQANQAVFIDELAKDNQIHLSSASVKLVVVTPKTAPSNELAVELKRVLADEGTLCLPPGEHQKRWLKALQSAGLSAAGHHQWPSAVLQFPLIDLITMQPRALTEAA